MNRNLARVLLVPLRTQQVAGAALLAIASILVATSALSLVPSPDTLSATLLVICGLIALAVSKTERGITSLIGLFFLATLVFIPGRPLLALFSRSDAPYLFFWGATSSPAGDELARLINFWDIGIAALFGGYFLSCGHERLTLVRPITSKGVLKQAFWLTFCITVVLIPFLLQQNFSRFGSAGYVGLYADQTGYSFSALRLADFLIPVLFGLAVLVREMRYTRSTAIAVTAYVLTGALFGQRTLPGSWLLVAVWYVSTIRQKSINRWALAGLALMTAIVFQWIEAVRDGSSMTLTISQFLIGQGIIFNIPLVAWHIASPPAHTLLGTAFPLGAIYHILDIGSPETSSLAKYIGSQSAPDLYAHGFALSSSLYVDLYYICLQLLPAYGVACVIFGSALRKLEQLASRNQRALLYLSACLPSLMFVQRGTLLAITSQAIYMSLYLSVLHGFFSLLRAARRNSTAAGENISGRALQ